MKIRIVAIICLSFLVFAVGCRKDKVGVVTPSICTDTIHFNTKILPMILTNCSTSGCHDSGSGSAGYVFTNYSDIQQNADIILSSMKGTAGALMPLNASAPVDSLIDPFVCWMHQGKLNN